MTHSSHSADFIIIGGGIAGASAGYELSQQGKVILLERETHPGYHTTGRSSAIFQKSYQDVDPLLHTLISASEDFLRHPPAEFGGHSLLTDRSLIYIAREDQQAGLDRLHRKLTALDLRSQFIGPEDIERMIPVLAPAYRSRALMETGIADMDVHTQHAGYLKMIKSRGGRLLTGTPVIGLKHMSGHWQVTTERGTFTAPVIINAAGAWVDQVAALAGITPINIQPLRRTVILVNPPTYLSPSLRHWPMVMNPTEGYYFKPDSGKILMTPGDHKLSPPCDIQPEEIDIAIGAKYLEQATTLRVRKIDHSWAGLRNHVVDHHPVAGFDPDHKGFFWLAGQGGFGLKTAPALARITAALIAGHGLPRDLLDRGLRQDQISVDRLK